MRIVKDKDHSQPESAMRRNGSESAWLPAANLRFNPERKNAQTSRARNSVPAWDCFFGPAPRIKTPQQKTFEILCVD